MKLIIGRSGKFSCRAATEAADVDLMEAPVPTWREGVVGLFLTEGGTRFQDRGDGHEAEPRGMGVGIEVCVDADLVGGVVVVIVGCPCKADAAEGVVDIALRRNNIESLNKGSLSADTM